MTVRKHSEEIIEVIDFLSAEQCERYVAASEEMGYGHATVNTALGQRVVEELRNNERVIHIDSAFAQELWQKIKDVVPAKIGKCHAIGLNPYFRFYRYKPGMKFRKHRDQSVVKDHGVASFYTFMIYLNENFKGGSTTFAEVEIKPETGKALIFLHDLEHEGSTVTEGIKYVLRTDVFYQFED